MSEQPREYYMTASSNLTTLTNKMSRMLGTLNYSDDESRYGLLMAMTKTSMWGIISLDDFMTRMNDPQFTKTRLNLNAHDVDQFFNSVHLYHRASFLTMFMFNVENLFKTILKEFDNLNSAEPKNYNGYYNICTAILKKSYGETIEEKHKFLILPSTLRNTLHSSGIHTGKPISFNVRGQTINFETGVSINHTGWDIIYHALDSLVDTLEDILQQPAVKNLTRIKISS